jgi:hypothetical protein
MGFVFKMMIPLMLILLIYGYMMGGDKVLDFIDRAPPKPTGVENISSALTDKDVTIYQWVDEKGVKHFSSTPPQGQDAHELRLSSKTNVIQSVKIPAKEEARPEKGRVTSVLKSPYSPGGGKEIIDQTLDLKDVMQQRMQQQQEMLEQISGHSK